MPHLFSPLTLRSVTLPNRILMAPMCTYSAGENGVATDWHLAHYLARAAGGTGLLLAEATAVEPRGRISQNDLGLWDDAQIAPLARIVELVHSEGAGIGVQLAHAGRKAWSASKSFGPEPAVGPSPLPYNDDWNVPLELSLSDLDAIVDAWRGATLRAAKAGFDVVEIHAAHGYLNHQFLSPLSNHRSDTYGGSLENRMRLLLRVTEAVRQAWPEQRALLVRLSATDWVDGGLTPTEVVAVSRQLKDLGVDLVDCSSGGNTPAVPPEIGPGYQVPFAEKVRLEVEIATAAVGLITAPEQADAIVRNGRADLVALGRLLLRRPYWPLEAARKLGHDIPWPRQYRRARLD